jgi:ABC-type antimicrobial peptide transport system permease subunit
VSFLESILTGLDEARRHWGQTVLALLGIVLGTGSIVAVLALFGGQAKHTQQYLDEVGGAGSMIVANQDLPPQPTARQLASERLTLRDADFLKAHASALTAVSPTWNDDILYRVGRHWVWGPVVGAEPDLFRIEDIHLLAGRWLSDIDVAQRSRVIVLGWKYADSLYGHAEAAIGQNVLLWSLPYRVVGVLTREEFYFASWEDNALEYRNERGYIPISTAVAQYAGTDPLTGLTVKADPEDVQVAEAQVRSLLFARHGVEDFEIHPAGSGGGGGSGQFLLLFDYIFLVIGVVSLFTGGIVIANILLASVVERVREFGTRMALGATSVGIFLHVLAEATVVTVLGGALGLALGTALTSTVARVMQMPAAVTPFIAGLALGTSVCVGLLAGTYPAIRAARLSPVEALRYG